LKEPKQILVDWMHAVNAGNVENLLALYNENAVLIPTFSNRILNTPGKLRAYFETLGSREELSISLHEKTLISQGINEATFTLSGIYCWRFAVEGELLSFEARFTYVLDMSNPRSIMHHHSSQVPRTL